MLYYYLTMSTDNQTRTIILNRAKTLFASKGYTQTSMRDIAKSAKISTGPLYFHFKHKNDILEAILTEAYEIFGQAITTLPHSSDDPLEQIENILNEYLELYQREKIYFQIGEHLALSGENLATNLLNMIGALEKRIYHQLEQIIARGVTNKALRHCDPKNTALALQAMIRGLIDNLDKQNPQNIIKNFLKLLIL